MAGIIFDRKEIEKHIKLTEENINKINLFGTPVEKLTDREIEVEVMPNRPDLFSLEGFVRAISAFIGKKNKGAKYTAKKPERNYKVSIDPDLKDLRPYTACMIVKNLSLDNAKLKSLIDMQEKLHVTLGRNRKKVAIGIYPLSQISLPLKYTAKKPSEIKFIPLESDKEMNALQIMQRHPTGKKYAHLLENAKKYPVFEDSKGQILSLIPLINSATTGRVTTSTQEVFVECSGTENETVKKTLDIIASTFIDMKGEIYSMTVGKELTPQLQYNQIKISLENVNRLLGLQLKQRDLVPLLEKMGLELSGSNVLIPPWRVDILHEVDVIEDIAIAYGYDSLIPQIPTIATEGGESEETKTKNKIASLLTGLELTEISTYHLIKPEEAERMSLKKPIFVENSKTDYKILRPNLLIPALRILSENTDNEYPQKVFEIGRIFSPDSDKETRIAEHDSLIIALTPANFTSAKQHLDYLLRNLSLSYSLTESSEDKMIPGRTADIHINGKKVGFLGEVHPSTLQGWNLKMPLAVIEISLKDLYKASAEN